MSMIAELSHDDFYYTTGLYLL